MKSLLHLPRVTLAFENCFFPDAVAFPRERFAFPPHTQSRIDGHVLAIFGDVVLVIDPPLADRLLSVSGARTKTRHIREPLTAGSRG